MQQYVISGDCENSINPIKSRLDYSAELLQETTNMIVKHEKALSHIVNHLNLQHGINETVYDRFENLETKSDKTFCISLFALGLAVVNIIFHFIK